jgi:hypothetical protein
MNPTNVAGLLIPEAALSEAWVCGSSLVGIAGPNSVGCIAVLTLVECCVLSGRGPCDGTIPRPEEPYRVWCV